MKANFILPRNATIQTTTANAANKSSQKYSLEDNEDNAAKNNGRNNKSNVNNSKDLLRVRSKIEQPKRWLFPSRHF